MMKAENSDEETDSAEELQMSDEDVNFDINEDNFEKKFNDLSRDPREVFRATTLAGKERGDKYLIDVTKKLSRKSKLSQLDTPDYCFIVQKDQLQVLMEGLHSLMRGGGVYYSKEERDDDPDQVIIVVYFDDNIIDIMAELMDVKCRLSGFDVMADFKCFAADFYESFSTRQAQHIIMRTFDHNFDIPYLMKSGVILNHFPLHSDKRQKIQFSWQHFRLRLAVQMLIGDFW